MSMLSLGKGLLLDTHGDVCSATVPRADGEDVVEVVAATLEYSTKGFSVTFRIFGVLRSLDGVVVVFEKDGRVAVDTSEGSSVVVVVVVVVVVDAV